MNVDYAVDKDNQKTAIKIKCINIAHNTLISNLFETLQRHNLTSEFIEIWQIKKSDKKIRTYYDKFFLNVTEDENDEDSDKHKDDDEDGSFYDLLGEI